MLILQLNNHNLFKCYFIKTNMEEEDREIDTESNEENSEETEEETNEEEPEETNETRNEIRIDNEPDKPAISKNPWITSTIILAVIVLVLIITNFTGITGNTITGNVIAENDAGDKIMDYLNARTGGGIEYVSAEDLGNIYEVTVKYQGQEVPVFITKDGEYFIQGAIPIVAQTPSQIQQNQEPQEVPKSDKPIVELFIMTHCPYGTQAEKGIIPVLELLGDKIDGTIRFVHYFMHEPEETETPIQVCIREEQGDKFNDYLKCFLEDGDSDRCLTETKIDQTKLNTCIKSKSEEYYNADSALSEDYGIRGSPSLIINEQQISSGRSSEDYLKTICSAFNTPPEECNQELDSESPSPGFGYSVTSGGSDTAQC